MNVKKISVENGPAGKPILKVTDSKNRIHTFESGDAAAAVPDTTKDSGPDVMQIQDCDLLIIDDLGTELTNSFVASQFFLCINERILRKKSTIISTNLTLGNFMDTYSERVFSRVSSSYTMIKLIGKDIRIQKKILGGN